MAGKNPLLDILESIAEGSVRNKVEMLAREEKFREQIGDEPITEIHKLVLPWQPGKIKLPLGAGVVHVGEQHHHIHIWYTCQPACTMFQTVPVAVVGTGQKMDAAFTASMTYFRTVQMLDGLVWHIFFGEPEYDPL